MKVQVEVIDPQSVKLNVFLSILILHCYIHVLYVYFRIKLFSFILLSCWLSIQKIVSHIDLALPNELETPLAGTAWMGLNRSKYKSLSEVISDTFPVWD